MKAYCTFCPISKSFQVTSWPPTRFGTCSPRTEDGRSAGFIPPSTSPDLNPVLQDMRRSSAAGLQLEIQSVDVSLRNMGMPGPARDRHRSQTVASMFRSCAAAKGRADISNKCANLTILFSCLQQLQKFHFLNWYEWYDSKFICCVLLYNKRTSKFELICSPRYCECETRVLRCGAGVNIMRVSLGI